VYKAQIVELRPTAEQIEFFENSAGQARFVYNKLLSHFSTTKTFSLSEAMFLVNRLRCNFDFLHSTSMAVQRCAARDLENAYKHFFRRCKIKKIRKKGYPKFKKKHSSKKSFSYREPVRFKFSHRTLKIEKLKTLIKTRNKPRFGNAKHCTIFERNNKWYASIMYKVDAPLKTPSRQPSVGVDLGIKHLAVLSDGTVFENPKPLKNKLNLLARLQRKLRRKEKGSNRHLRLKRKIAELHFYVAMQRKAYLHELTSYLVKNYDTVVIEDLNVKGMMKNRKLAAAIADVGWGMFKTFLTYKAEAASCNIVVADRFFPSSKTCSNCSHKKKEFALSERTFKCERCGISLDRDLNASYNLNNIAKGLKEM
jgi:putative transposase